ncbi:MAG: GNAT family N-acetyltransferase [Steroidobacteraceae bacterium]
MASLRENESIRNRHRKAKSVEDEEYDRTLALASARAYLWSSTEARNERYVKEWTGLTVEVAATIDALRGLKSDYERLQLVTGNTLPFALHDWHVAWCEHFLNVNKHIYAQPMIQVVRNPEQACVAIVPLILTRRAIGPVKLATLDLLGADPAITEIRGPLVEPGYEVRAASAVQQTLATLRHFDWVQWSGISAAFGAALGAGAKLHWQEPLLSYVLDLPPSWELLRARLKRNIRESIRHCYNSLKRDGLEFRLQVVDQPEPVKHALERFFSLHTLRANLTGTVKHPDYFASAVARRFLQDVCERLALRGVVRVFQLAIGQEVVAARIGFVVGNSLYLYYSGFDPRWSKYSVMTTTLVEAIKYAIAEGYSTINFSPGRDISKTRWGPREVEVVQATQLSASWWSHLAWTMYRRARSDGFPLETLEKLSRQAKREWI